MLSGTIDFSHRRGFYGGNMYKWQFTPLLKLTENLSVNVNYLINDATLPGGSFVDHVVNTRINYAFNNQWLTSTTLQHDNRTSFLGVNFRLNYIFRPGDDFFLVYNEGRRALFDSQDRPDYGSVRRPQRPPPCNSSSPTRSTSSRLLKNWCMGPLADPSASLGTRLGTGARGSDWRGFR